MAEAGATISGVEKTGEIILKGLVYFAQKDQNGAVIASIACNARAMLQKWEGIAILEQYDHLRFNDETDEWRLLHIYAPAIRSEAFAINKILSKYDPRGMLSEHNNDIELIALTISQTTTRSSSE